MNDDYLWDKSGEPDKEVKELEDILGVLRYQPRPLELPQDVVSPRKRNLRTLLAIAATVAIALLATGIWFTAQIQKAPNSTSSKKEERVPPAPTTKESNSPVINPNEQAVNNVTQSTGATSLPTARVNYRKRQTGERLRALRREREEAIAAKEQLLLALRVASEKLSQAQRKAQNTSVNQIRNQHKVG